MKVVIIGSGNVAWHLVNAIQSTTHQLIQLVNLNTHKISEDFEKFNIPVACQPSEINLSADIYIIAVSDNSIENLSLPIFQNKQIVLHTSGIADINTLKNYGSNYGCLYPVQSLTKGIAVDFSKIPLIIESSNEMTKELLMNFALSLSPYILSLPLHKRSVLHLAAVLVNNFTNHLFVQAKELMDKERMSFDLLKPLIAETVNKLNNLTPLDAQTGPAKRNDESTIRLHENLMQDNQRLLRIYELMTLSIQHQSNQ